MFNLGDGLLMSSRASLTAAMIEAAITSEEAKRSCFCFFCSSWVIALRVSPMTRPRSGRSDKQPVRQLASEDVGRHVPTLHAAQRTVSNDPRIRHCLYWCWDVLAAALAGDCEVAKSGIRQVPHPTIIGEQTANMLPDPKIKTRHTIPYLAEETILIMSTYFKMS